MNTYLKISLVFLLSTSGFVISNISAFDIRFGILVCIFLVFFLGLSGNLILDRGFLKKSAIILPLFFIPGILMGLYVNPLKTLAQVFLFYFAFLAAHNIIRRVGVFECVKIYINLVYIFSLIGIFQFALYLISGINLNSWGPFPGHLIGENTIRVSSIFSEPSSFGFFCYLFVALMLLGRRRFFDISNFKKTIMWTGFLLTGSAVGYIYLM